MRWRNSLEHKKHSCRGWVLPPFTKPRNWPDTDRAVPQQSDRSPWKIAVDPTKKTGRPTKNQPDTMTDAYLTVHIYTTIRGLLPTDETTKLNLEVPSEEGTFFPKLKYRVQIMVRLTKFIKAPTSCLLNTGVGRSLINDRYLWPTWSRRIRNFQRRGFQQTRVNLLPSLKLSCSSSKCDNCKSVLGSVWSKILQHMYCREQSLTNGAFDSFPPEEQNRAVALTISLNIIVEEPPRRNNSILSEIPPDNTKDRAAFMQGARAITIAAKSKSTRMVTTSKISLMTIERLINHWTTSRLLAAQGIEDTRPHCPFPILFINVPKDSVVL